MDDGRPHRVFPDTYSIKAVGKDADHFAAYAKAIVEAIVGSSDPITHSSRASKNGAYISVTLHFVAQDQQQLDLVFTTMNADSRVLWVL